MLNNSSNLYGSEWLALVFSNRNQNYGAYALRSQSSNILLKALFIAAPLFVLLFVGPMIYAQLHKEAVVKMEYEHPVTLADPIHEMKKIEPEKQEPAKAEPIKQVSVKTVKLTANIKVVNDPIDDTPPPTSVEIQKAVIGNITQDGPVGGTNALPATNGGGNGTTTDGAADPNTIYNGGVDAYPEFPGGMEAWSKFIQKNLRYPYAAQDQGIQGKVYLSFVVEKDGSITDVKVIRGIGYGCDDEAIRVIKKSPKWRAGQQNKQTVRVRYNMPISYTLTQ